MRLSLVATIVCIVLVLAAGAQGAGDRYAALLAPTAACGAAENQVALDRTAAQVVMTCLTNYARTRAGLRPLQTNPALVSAGNAKLTADVACNAFTHEPCGRPFDSVFAAYLRGATSFQIGENIAWGTGSYGSPRQIMDAWLHSQDHRKNILTPAFTEVGIGYLSSQTFQGHADAALWSQEFGTKRLRPQR